MIYTDKNGAKVQALRISEVSQSGFGNYAISLPEANKTVGLYIEQTKNYVPQVGDYYIDNGEIADSLVVSATDFANNYTEAA